MNTEKQICTTCNTGKKTFELDKTNPFCPYIDCLKDGKCGCYEALDFKQNSLNSSI